MLTSLILHLEAPARLSLPAQLGRASQAALLRLIEQRDATLAADLHQGAGLRPLTASNLVMGTRSAGSLRLEAGQTGWLRFTGLTAAVSEQLLAVAAGPPGEIELDRVAFRVSGATVDPGQHPWAGQISYQALASPYLLGGQEQPASRVTLEFASPTTFRSQGRYQPLPVPELVFGSLLDRWQAFAPIALNPELRRFAAEAIALTRYQLHTHGLPYKTGGMQIGFTGKATFSALNRDRYWLNMLQLLAAFAFYSGVGYQTTSGLGQTRRLRSDT